MPGAAETLNLSGAPPVMRALLSGRTDFRAPLRTVALYLNAQARKCFDEQRAPDGTPWAKFKRPPSVKRGGSSSKLLRDTGILMGSMTAQVQGHVEEVTATSLRWGSNVPYAAFHQYGTRFIPARPFLGITAKDVERIGLIVTEWLKKAVP